MPNDRQPMTLRLTPERHEWLRTNAFTHRMSMQEIIDASIDLMRNTPEWHPWVRGEQEPSD